MPRDLQSELRARLCSPVSGKCLSVLNELSAALALKSMPSKVRLYPNYPKKGPDISAELRSRPIFFELTSLGIGKTESKLLKVCRGVGKVLHRSHTPTSLLHVDIDSARLVWNRKGHLLVKQSIRKSVKLANDMRLRDIFDSFRSFHVLDPAGTYGGDETARIRHLIQTYPNERGFRSRQFKIYFKSASTSLLEASPIRSFWKIRARTRLTQVAAEMAWPSKAGALERTAFLDRVERGLLQKIRHGQLQTGSPNVIAIRLSDWTFPNYENASPLDFDWEFKPLKYRIRTVVNASRSPALSAVMFFEEKFQNAWVVGNRYAAKPSKLTNSEYIDLYGRHRINTIKKAKIAQRIRKKIIAAKVTVCANSIKCGYEQTSKIRKIAHCRMFNKQTDANLHFVECPHKFWIQKVWLRDPSRHPDFSESGRIVALREEQFFVDQLLKNSITRQLAQIKLRDAHQRNPRIHNPGRNT